MSAQASKPLIFKPRAGLKGRQVSAQARQEVLGLMHQVWPPTAQQSFRRDLLIEYLHALHDCYGALFERHLAALAEQMKLAQVEVFEVASFYHHFEILRDAQAAPRLRVRVCEGLSCAMAQSGALRDRLLAAMPDDVQMESVACMGRCEQAPAVCVGQNEMGFAHFESVSLAVAAHAVAPRRCGNGSASKFIGWDDYVQDGGYALLRALHRQTYDPLAVLRSVEQAHLRGLGGAGFPVGKKWRIVREQAGEKLMVVNIDEGEPGTFKDRWYLERDPHRFLEGMLVAAQVVGVAAIYIYLRDEYHALRQMLQEELIKLKAQPPCPLPAIELRRGAGAYICGEESAMIESIEGRRGQPRMRPPYIAQLGLFGRPTLAHNFETLYWVREIVERGGDWFAAHGRHGRKGLRSFSVSGRVKQAGVKLAPAGITAQELIDEYCGGMLDGHRLYAYLPGGASGGILPARLAHLPLDFDTLQPYGCFIGSAAVIVLSEHDSARDAALNMMRFFAQESCGQCTPCRVGAEKSAQLMGQALWDAPLLHDLSDVMLDASICGLGQAAPNVVRCVLKYFAHEVQA